MKIAKLFFFIWFLIVASFSTAHDVEPEKPLSLQIKRLNHWKNTPEASTIQHILGTTAKLGRNDTSIFKKPFLLLNAESSAFGGFSALVVFRNHPKVFRLWIYEIDKNLFEIREVTTLQVSLNKEIMNELDDKRIAQFWLTPLP